MNAIGLVAVIDGEELNTYILEVLNGILEDATKHGQNTVVCSIPSWEAAETEIHALCDGRVDGIIFVAPRLPASFFETLQIQIPVVTIHHEGAGKDVYNLDSDGEYGAYLAVRYLTDLGHRRILHITGEPDLYVTCQRLAGYRRVLAECRISYDPELVIHGALSACSARQTVDRIFQAGRFDPFPTAIFAANDAIAIGCMEALAEYGVRVPEEVSIVGFDDTLAARMTVPPLTTVRQPLRLLGRRAVEVLVDRIESGRATEDETLPPYERMPNVELFDASLIVRGTAVAPSPPIASH